MISKLERYKTIETIPTNRGRSVIVVESPAGERFVIKSAHNKRQAEEIDAQVRQFATISRLMKDDTVYPNVIAASPGTLVLPFYEHGTIYDVVKRSDTTLSSALIHTAMVQLLRIGQIPPPVASPSPEVARRFLPSEGVARLVRLSKALASPVGRQWAGHELLGQCQVIDVLKKNVAWLQDKSVFAGLERIGPPQLTLAAHGDFTAKNLLLTAADDPKSKLIFIDVRGFWHNGYPWWDPILDLASIGFSIAVQETFSAISDGFSEKTDSCVDSLTKTTEQVLKIALACPEFVRWTEQDWWWRIRFEVAIAIRLLGGVSVQLMTAPHDAKRRASALLNMYVYQMSRISEIIEQLSIKPIPDPRLSSSLRIRLGGTP